MKTLTVYQPWASLIILGAKPYEFRGHDYRPRNRNIEGERIVIHAAARPMVLGEMLFTRRQIIVGASNLDRDIALPLLERCISAMESSTSPQILELSAGLGTAVLGTPRPVGELFADVYDSDRLDHSKWAWPLTEIEKWDTPVPRRGNQGFWNW